MSINEIITDLYYEFGPKILDLATWFFAGAIVAVWLFYTASILFRVALFVWDKFDGLRLSIRIRRR